MDGYGEEPALEFERYPKTGSYEIKRSIAYLIDQLLAFFVVLIVAFVLTDGDLTGGMTWIWIILFSGILNFLLKVIEESMMGVSIGKTFLGLKVIDAYGPVTAGGSIARNISNMIPFLPILDYFIGQGSALDSRQKLTDSMSRTLVIEDMVIESEKPKHRPRPITVEPPKPREKVKLDYRRVRHGKCPRCGAPYRVLDPGDDSFNGLWNHRCTWCNHLITEESGRRGSPGR
ncbi:MAG: RDD family protein [Thermoplasmatota archaeon]